MGISFDFYCFIQVTWHKVITINLDRSFVKNMTKLLLIDIALNPPKRLLEQSNDILQNPI